MAWYYGKFVCGHEGRVNVIGPIKDRQWKIDKRFEGLCPECYEKQKKEEREKREKEAKEQTEEMELPELMGSEKQTKWATTLRVDAIRKMNANIEELSEKNSEKIKLYDYDDTRIKTSKSELLQCVDYACTDKVDSKFWIDNRYSSYDMLVHLLKELREKEEQEQIPKDVIEEQKQFEIECTKVPENELHPGVVEIEEEEGYIVTRYIKDEDFRRIVKSHSFHWESDKRVWRRKLSYRTGDYKNYAALIGNALLLEGFSIRILNKDILNDAVDGKFTPETKRWIAHNTENGKLTISWEKRNEELYQRAKSLPGAYYRLGEVFVSPEFFREVLDFVECYGFSVSPGAEKAIQKEKKSAEKRERVKVTPAEIPEKIDNLKNKLKSSGTIIEDLRDED